MENILNFANDISLDRVTNMRVATSVSGFERRLRGGPTFYNLNIGLPLLNQEQYNLVDCDLIDMKDGLSPVSNVIIPSKINLITNNSVLNASGTITLDTLTGLQGTNTIQLNGVSSDSYVTAGDYIQTGLLNPTSVRSDFKVYQIKTSSEAQGNIIRFDLNQPIIVDLVWGSSGFNFGNDCLFKVILEQRPDSNIVPGPVFNYHEFDTFRFKEVI